MFLNVQSVWKLHLFVLLFLRLFLWSAAEVDDSQDSSIMTDADDTQLHTAESDDVL